MSRQQAPAGWRAFYSIKAALVVSLLIYALCWECAMLRMIDAEFDVKTSFAATFLGAESNPCWFFDHSSASLLREFETNHLGDRLNQSRYGFDSPADRKPFLKAADDLRFAPEGSYAFAEALIGLNSASQNWGLLHRPSEADRPYFKKKDYLLTGDEISKPTQTTGSQREGARRYMAVAPMFFQLLVYRDRNLLRFLPLADFARPWEVLRFNNPSFADNCQGRPTAMLALLLAASFLLELYYGVAPRSTPVWGKDSGRPLLPRSVWMVIGVAISIAIPLCFEKNEMQVEWIITVIATPIIGFTIPVIVTTLAAIHRSGFSKEFKNLSATKRRQALRPFVIFTIAMFASSAWAIRTSIIAQLFRGDGGGFSRGAMQLAAIGLILFWTVRVALKLRREAGIDWWSARAGTPEDGLDTRLEMVKALAFAILPALSALTQYL